MKTIKWITLLLLLGTVGIGSAWADRGRGHAHHSRGHFSVMIGANMGHWFHPPLHYYPPYYPPVVFERVSPPVYIEQQSTTPASQTNYWYYCNSSRAYYPYVKECPGGWQKVLPQPPG